MKTYLACMGTRPEIIKMAALHRILRERGDRVLVLHTGQHEAMALALYRLFDMGPDLQMDLQRLSPRLGDLTSSLLAGVDRIVSEVQPDAVIVQGDTSSALVGALAGYYHDIPVAHVEAGLRTGTRDPFPEEKNREIIARLARWHFPPTIQGRQNLVREGIDPAQIFVVGNTVIDAARWMRARLGSEDFDYAAAIPAQLHRFTRLHPVAPMMLVTAHRRENWGEPIRNIAAAVGRLLDQQPAMIVVWPVHPNPSVRADVEGVLDTLPPQSRMRVCLTDPLGYPAMIAMLDRCYFALTDSGGVQEEASAMGRPVLIARESTERQELVSAGGARLVGTSADHILAAATKLLTRKDDYRTMQLDDSPFGDGLAAFHIADILGTTTNWPRGTLENNKLDLGRPLHRDPLLSTSASPRQPDFARRAGRVDRRHSGGRGAGGAAGRRLPGS